MEVAVWSGDEPDVVAKPAKVSRTTGCDTLLAAVQVGGQVRLGFRHVFCLYTQTPVLQDLQLAVIDEVMLEQTGVRLATVLAHGTLENGGALQGKPCLQEHGREVFPGQV